MDAVQLALLQSKMMSDVPIIYAADDGTIKKYEENSKGYNDIAFKIAYQDCNAHDVFIENWEEICLNMLSGM